MWVSVVFGFLISVLVSFIVLGFIVGISVLIETEHTPRDIYERTVGRWRKPKPPA